MNDGEKGQNLAIEAIMAGLRLAARVVGLDEATRQAVEDARLDGADHKNWIMQAWERLRGENNDE